MKKIEEKRKENLERWGGDEFEHPLGPKKNKDNDKDGMKKFESYDDMSTSSLGTLIRHVLI